MGTKFYKAQKALLRSAFALTGRFLTVSFLFFIISIPGYSQTSSLSFTQLSGDFMAPGKGAQNWGLHTWNDITQPTIPAGNTVAKNYYTRFNWRDIESSTVQGSYNWTAFDNYVNQAIDAGAMFSFGLMPLCDGCGTGGAIPQYVVDLMTAEGKPGPIIGGVVYPNYQSTNWKNRYSALMRAVANHIATTSRNGHPYSSAFLAYDLRHAGNFGEFADLYNNAAYGAGAQVTDTYLNAMVDSAIAIYPNVQLTIPMGYFTQNANLYGNSSGAPGQASAYHVLTASNNYGRIGWRRDNIGDDGYNVYFTGNTGSYDPGTGVVQFQPLIMNMWQFAPIGGEPSSSQSGVSRCGTIYCDLHNENTLFHYSYFGNGNAPGGVSNTSGATWTQLQTNWRAASAEQGYRLILTGGSMTTTLSSGGPFNITVNWQNIGLAPVYEKWNVTYELRNSSGTVVWTGNSAFTPRLFLPQASATPVSDNFTLSSVPSGTYNMYMIIRDPLNYKAPLTLAINGRNADGSYLIRNNITVGTGGPVNQLPTANAGADKTIQLPTSSVSLTGTGTDPDGTISTYSWTKLSGPSAGTIATPTTANTNITGLVQGVYMFVLTVTDNQGGTGKDTVQVTVNAATNQLPTANAGADQTIQLPTSTVSLAGTGTDADGTISNYAWTKLSGPAGQIIVTPATANTNITGLVQGVYTFVLTVTDNLGGTGKDTVQVTVNAAVVVNQPPVSNAGADQNITLPTNSVTINGSASSDPDGSITSYLWTKISGPAQFAIGNTSSASTIVNNLTAGVYSFQLKVTDNVGATTLDTVKVTVNAAINQPPVANAGIDQSITLPTNSVTINGTGSNDTDGSIASYLWTKIGGPTQFTIGNSGAASTTVSNLTAGQYSFQLKVTDNLGATAMDTVNINVIPAPVNQPPIANAGADQTITLPVNSVTINGAGSSDPDGSISSYLWTKISGPTQFTIGNTSTASTLVSNLTAGLYTFQLKVTDNGGAIALDTIKVNVNPAPANQLPVANAGADITITLPTNVANLDGSASSDPDGTISAYAWSQISGPSTATAGSPTNATTGISGLLQGVYIFSLKVTDNSGGTDLDSIRITVNPAPNEPPVANAGSGTTITLPVNTINLNGSLSSDPDGSIVSYSWTEISGPSAATMSGASTSVATASNLIAGLYTFELTVTDNNGATAKAAVKITVASITVQPPVANAGADQTITLPTNSVTIDGSSSSASSGGSIVSYVWAEKSGPSVVSVSNTTQNTLTNLLAGVYVFSLTVTDNNGASDADSVTITVNKAKNQKPYANAGSNKNLTLPKKKTILGGAGISTVDSTASTTLDGSASYDPDGSVVSYSWTQVSGPSSSTLSGSNTAIVSVSGLIEGQYVYQLTVVDNNGDSSSAQVNVNVLAAPNVIPVANAGANQSITAPANAVNLNGSASYDPDGSISTYTWATVSGPGAVTISNSNTATPSVSGLLTGVYIFQLTVTDNSGATAMDQVTVIVNPTPVLPNQAPVANAGTNQTITEPDNTISLNGTSSFDPDGTITGYSWTQISGPSVSVISGSNTATPTVSQLTVGQYIIQLTVTDNNGTKNSDQITITVNATVAKVNLPPVANAGINDTLSLPNDTYTLDASQSTDPDGTIQDYQWQQIGGPNTVSSVSMNSAQVTLSGLQVGEYEFQVTVTDNSGATSTATMKLTVIDGTSTVTDRFVIYPNPVHDIATGSITSAVTGTVKVNVYDMNGKLVLVTEVEKTDSVVLKTFDVNLLAPGMYTVQINIANRKTMVTKFIKY